MLNSSIDDCERKHTEVAVLGKRDCARDNTVTLPRMEGGVFVVAALVSWPIPDCAVNDAVLKAVRNETFKAYPLPRIGFRVCNKLRIRNAPHRLNAACRKTQSGQQYR